MTEEQVLLIGKLLHTALVGKTIEVDHLNFFRDDDNSYHLSGPFRVRVLPASESCDLEEINDTHYDPNWSVEPEPDQGLPIDARTFWCGAVEYELATQRWLVKFKEVPPPVKSYRQFRVDMSGMACMRGVLRVHATDEEDARYQALGKTGDVSWKYGGIDDATVSVDNVEPV